MFKCKNVVKSSKVARVNNIVSDVTNGGTYVKIGTVSHTQYNNDVSMLNYQNYTKYQKDTINNIALYSATDESLDFTSFVTIGEEVIICDCITMHDIIDAYATGSIQDWYECFCESHSDEESIVLARFLSAIGIEIWKDITCYDGVYSGLYMVSNLGRILSLNRKKHFGKMLKQFDKGLGYLYVQLCCKGKLKNVRVNRLVALTFYGEPTEPLVACHANTNKADNRLFNLDLKTQSENILNPITQRKAKETLKSKAAAATDKESTETV